VYKTKSLFSHKLIEECMLAANEAVAGHLADRDIPFPCRMHPEPEAEQLEHLYRALAGAGLPPEVLKHVPGGENRRSARALQALLDAAAGAAQTALVGRMVLRAMMQARYAPEVSAHFGLASACYCHFTSPIRRYADLIAHRALRHAMGQSTGIVPARYKLLAIAGQCNVRERAAREAERETARRMACLLLREREGEVLPGVISSVLDFGFFVELDDMPVEGLVKLGALADDWYVFDPDGQSLRGRAAGRVFRVGQALRVVLERVDMERLEINLRLPGRADGSAAPGGGKRPGGGRRIGRISLGKRLGKRRGRSFQKVA
jgi:ribonuclease R